MTDKEQIEEMARLICNSCSKNGICEIESRPCDTQCGGTIIAKRLYKNDYRKTSEVAREIIQDIVEPIWRACQNSENEMTSLLAAFICEYITTKLKKEYTEGKG